jgi:nicotinate-nucleotide pyrophosphorylase (carboxylating)
MNVMLLRQDLIRRAFFRGDQLTLNNPEYLGFLIQFCELLRTADKESKDLSANALGLPSGQSAARIIAKEAGVVAGLAEFQWLYNRAGLDIRLLKQDGEEVLSGEIVGEIQGNSGALLSLERVGLNLLQRMSGISTATRRLQQIVRQRSDSTFVIGTRKVQWGPLDKRALHLGGGGTHRLSLADAIMIKNNHLRLFGSTEQEAVPKALERVWQHRLSAAFIEVEVRSPETAVTAAGAFQRLMKEEAQPLPCVVMFDNFSVRAAEEAVRTLQQEGLWNSVLTEASGRVTESTIGDYAATGVDVISVGALTHSVKALDLSQTFD